MTFIPDSPPPPPPCTDPQHCPPSHMVWPQSGTWICPSCGLQTRINVVTCGNISTDRTSVVEPLSVGPRPPHGGYPGEVRAHNYDDWRGSLAPFSKLQEWSFDSEGEWVQRFEDPRAECSL